MVVWSAIQKAGISSLSSFAKNGQLVRNFKTSVSNPSGHGGHFEIKASQWQWTKFKDFVHFYVMVGSVPCLLTMFFTNVFIGPATLTEIPEGYEPQHWEYEKHPITRFISKWFHPSPQEIYEKKLDRLYELDEILKIKILIKKLDILMSERNDQQVYYYKPISSSHFQGRVEEAEHFRDVLSGSDQ